jgi:hypothetical protein
MPDSSIECGIILGKLQVIQETLIEHQRLVAIEIKDLKDRIEEIRIHHAHEGGREIGEQEMISKVEKGLSKIGAIVLVLLSGVGWVAVNGIPTPVKKLFYP